MSFNKPMLNNEPNNANVSKILRDHSQYCIDIINGTPITSIPIPFISSTVLWLYFQTNPKNENENENEIIFIRSLPPDIFIPFIITYIINLNILLIKYIPTCVLTQEDCEHIVRKGGYLMLSPQIQESNYLSRLAVQLQPGLILKIVITPILIQVAVISSNWDTVLFLQILNIIDNIDEIPRDILI